MQRGRGLGGGLGGGDGVESSLYSHSLVKSTAG